MPTFMRSPTIWNSFQSVPWLQRGSSHLCKGTKKTNMIFQEIEHIDALYEHFGSDGREDRGLLGFDDMDELRASKT